MGPDGMHKSVEGAALLLIMVMRKSAGKLKESKFGENSGNYRPVGFISFPGKVMKQLILKIISMPIKNEKVFSMGKCDLSKQKSA